MTTLQDKTLKGEPLSIETIVNCPITNPFSGSHDYCLNCQYFQGVSLDKKYPCNRGQPLKVSEFFKAMH